MKVQARAVRRRLFGFVLLFFAGCGGAAPPRDVATGADVISGDSVRLTDDRVVRLALGDAPNGGAC